ncbi:SOS response-associated peptidase [Paracoccus laeviglucosivorans]|uniref:Abasic site processing protein n=1 Tax=Paracoccus laeviglucosivorans TaxID=1197861 RepID=A0A521FNS3_9RHOB|nr:SOS response-associated peptidase family protein [Paracoccus laeviglucosivorans]SMO97776.1 Putative SOS response-associated peptidase YedK [Paracoccus laeviglucosivorans]
MCNLYNVTTNQQAMRDVVQGMQDSLGNLEPVLDIYPDRPAPVIRNTPHCPELARLTWGMPTPPQFLKAPDAPDTGVTNIRNTASPHWRRWLGVENRCLVPATAFSEYGAVPDPVTKRKPLHWFALSEAQPLFFFAGIWTPWQGTRGSARTPRAGAHELFAFLTCEPNAVVAPVHPKAMPAILTTKDEIEMWLKADWPVARALQRPLPDAALQIISSPVRQA